MLKKIKLIFKQLRWKWAKKKKIKMKNNLDNVFFSNYI